MAGQQQAELVPVQKLLPHPRNARKHLTRPKVLESLATHGQYRPLIAQRSTGHVLAGNGLLAAMQDRGDTEAWVWWLDVDDDEALRILLVDNASSDGSGYDDQRLHQLLEEVASTTAGFAGTGWGSTDLDDLRELLAAPLSPAELAAKHGTEEPADTWWPTLRVRIPQRLLDRYQRLCDLTELTEPDKQLQRIVVWAERGRSKGKQP